MPRRAGLGFALIAAAVGIGLLLSACDSGSSHKRRASSPAPLAGYMLSEPDRVEYIQWTDAAGQLSGQVQIARLPDSGAFTVLTQNFPFTGTHSGSNVSLSVDQGGHTAVTWTGTLADDTLQLVSPAPSGLLQTKSYHLTTVDGYNQATIAFKSAVKAKSDVTAADANVAAALQKLHADAGTLAAGTQFDDATRSFDPDLSSLQSAYQAAQAAGQQPFDCSHTSDLANARASVSRWLSSVQADDRALTAMEKKVTSNADAVSADIASARSQLQALQTAMQVPVASGVEVHTSPNDVTTAEAEAQTQLDASRAAADAAQARYGDYLNRASDMDSQAASLVSQLACPSSTPQPSPPPQPVVVASGQGTNATVPLAAPLGNSIYAVVTPPDGVNVRAQPGSIDRVGCLTQGSTVRITDGPRSAAGENWYYAHDFGWIAASYLNRGVAAPPSAPGDAVSSVLAFYAALDRHDLQAAWALTSRAYKASLGNDFDRWASGFASTRSVIVGHVENQSGGILVEFVAVDAGPVVGGWSITWSTVYEGGSMRLDRSSAATRLKVCA